MKIAETIYTLFQKVIWYQISQCPATFGKQYSEENSWNELNN